MDLATNDKLVSHVTCFMGGTFCGVGEFSRHPAQGTNKQSMSDKDRSVSRKEGGRRKRPMPEKPFGSRGRLVMLGGTG